MQRLTPYIEDTENLLTTKLNKICTHAPPTINLGSYLHYFAFDVLGEVAFSRKFGFLAAECDVEGAIKAIDDMQWYDGIIGQIPEWDWVFRRNPLWRFVPWLGLDPDRFLVTRMAVEELGKRKMWGGGVGVGGERWDLMSSLMRAHEKAPGVFGEGDVFAVAHGAMFVLPFSFLFLLCCYKKTKAERFC